jgi:hypothetical protein
VVLPLNALMFNENFASGATDAAVSEKKVTGFKDIL